MATGGTVNCLASDSVWARQASIQQFSSNFRRVDPEADFPQSSQSPRLHPALCNPIPRGARVDKRRYITGPSAPPASRCLASTVVANLDVDGSACKAKWFTINANHERPIRSSADEHVQTSESPNMAAATPSARREPRRRRSSTPGCSSWTRNHPQPASVLHKSAARKVSVFVWRAHIPDTYTA